MRFANDEEQQSGSGDDASSRSIPAFRVEWRDDTGTRSVWAFGEADLVAVDSLEQALACTQPRLEVDLREVSFMDLAALRTLLDAAETHEIVCLDVSARVERLLDLTGTNHLFEIK